MASSEKSPRVQPHTALEEAQYQLISIPMEELTSRDWADIVGALQEIDPE